MFKDLQIINIKFSTAGKKIIYMQKFGIVTIYLSNK